MKGSQLGLLDFTSTDEDVRVIRQRRYSVCRAITTGINVCTCKNCL